MSKLTRLLHSYSMVDERTLEEKRRQKRIRRFVRARMHPAKTAAGKRPMSR